jgi:hypothetical protein
LEVFNINGVHKESWESRGAAGMSYPRGAPLDTISYRNTKVANFSREDRLIKTVSVAYRPCCLDCHFWFIVTADERIFDDDC